MTKNESEDTIDQLLIDIMRSIRYHDRRYAFFINLVIIVRVFNILLAGTAIFGYSTLEPNVIYILSAIVALCNIVDISINFSDKLVLHKSLKEKFINLEIYAHSDNANAKELKRKILAVEQEEPPIYRALDVLCHNEIVQAHGYDMNKNWYPVNMWYRLTSNLLRHESVNWVEIKNKQNMNVKGEHAVQPINV